MALKMKGVLKMALMTMGERCWAVKTKVLMTMVLMKSVLMTLAQSCLVSKMRGLTMGESC